MDTTKTVMLPNGDQIELTHSPIRTRVGPLGLLPGQGDDGYGEKIALPWIGMYAGKRRRVYCAQFGNSESWWFLHQGQRVHLSG